MPVRSILSLTYFTQSERGSEVAASAGMESHSDVPARSGVASLPGWGAAVLLSTAPGKRTPGREAARGKVARTAERKYAGATASFKRAQRSK